MALALCFALCAAAVATAAEPPGPASPPDPAMQRVPPPMLKSEAAGMPGAGGVPAGTRAPDGLGETVNRAATAGAYDAAQMTYVPWLDASEIRPLAVGSRMPAGLVVRSVEGGTVDLDAAVAGKPTVLIFYRGGWCPYCTAHLRELQKSEGALRELGYQILAISSDSPEAIRATDPDGQLSYRLLSDPGLEAAAQFGLRYRVNPRYIEHVKAKPDARAALAHVDLATTTGGHLLTPGAFILDRSGTIRFAYVNNNYSVRVRQEVLLTAARDALR